MSIPAPRRLPPDCTQSQFQAFIEKTWTICSRQNVTVVSPDVELADQDYMNPCLSHDMHAVYDRDFFVASALVCPRDVPEVQALMRLCNEFKIPVWPYSIGRNVGYGGPPRGCPGALGSTWGGT